MVEPTSNSPSHPPVETEQAKPKPFQFTVRALLLLPLGVVAVAATGHWFGAGWASLVGLACSVGLYLWVWYKMNRSVVQLLAVFALLGLVVALLLPACESARPAARRAACTNRLKQIGLGLHTYHDEHGCFPPAVVTDEAGRPLHGWRTLILPYMDNQALYDQIDLGLAWDAPENQPIASTVILDFVCPSTEAPRTQTSYVAIIGPGTAWLPNGCRANKDFADGPSNTILMVEVADSGIEWMEPRDLTLEELSMAINATPDKSVSSRHGGGANVLFADGSVGFLPEDLLTETLRAMLTVNGGETIE